MPSTPNEVALKVARAFLMYLGDCEETDTEPGIYGEDGFAEYLVETIPSAGIDLTQALHGEAKTITEVFTGAITESAWFDGYQAAISTIRSRFSARFLDDFNIDGGGDCCGHQSDEHNPDGGCMVCECRAWGSLSERRTA